MGQGRRREKLADALGELASRLAGDGIDRDELAVLREAVAELRSPAPVEVVEQGTMFRKSPAVPDGHSWSDISEHLVGKFSGIRLQKGEPFVEQNGRVLMVRSADNYVRRLVPVYQRVSSVRGQTVLVVWGKLGERSAYLRFDGGHEGPVVPISGSAELAGVVVAWLEHAWQNPLP